LKEMSANFTPLAMPIIDFHKPAMAGMLFEVACGEGKLLVSGIDLSANRPEAQQLRRSLLDYVASEAFKPTEQVSEQWLTETLMPPKRDVPPRPEAYKSATAYIECATFRASDAGDVAWRKREDRAELSAGD
jgi:hypothetical protein